MKQSKMNYSRFIVIFALQLHVLIEAELYIKDPIDYGLISPSLPTNADFVPGQVLFDNLTIITALKFYDD